MEEIKRLILEKLDMKVVDTPPSAKVPDPKASTVVNLCQEVSVGEKMIKTTHTRTWDDN